MLEEVEWGEFKIGDLFEVTGTKSLDSNAIDFVKNGINFIGRTFENNGIQGKIEERDFKPNAPFTITATVIGNYKYVKYQKEPYYCSQNINKLTPNFQINERLAIFFISLIQKFVSQYNGQQGGYKLNEIKNYKIKLPICKDRTINFSFMEKFIAELEASHLAELEAYLTVSNLKNYNLTQAEEKVLKEFENGKIEWGEFRIEDILDWQLQIKEINPLHIPNLTDNNENLFPFYGQSTVDNGIIDYIKLKKEVLNNKKVLPTILIHSNNQNVVFLETPFYLKDGHGATSVLQSKFLNRKNALCIMSCIQKIIRYKFSYQNKATKIALKNTIISLPIKDSKVNYEVMETFISAIQKLVIKDVVLYSDRKLKATKEVVEG